MFIIAKLSFVHHLQSTSPIPFSLLNSTPSTKHGLKPLEKRTLLASNQTQKNLYDNFTYRQFTKHLSSWLQTANLADGWGRRCVHKQFKPLQISLGALLLSFPSFLCPNVREQTGHAAVAEEYIYLIVNFSLILSTSGPHKWCWHKEKQGSTVRGGRGRQDCTPSLTVQA